jgi:dihydroorotate dehydrogenase electron transfer subunit
MKAEYSRVEVIENKKINEDIFMLVIENYHNGIDGLKPGQFYMLRGWNQQPLLSRPISISAYDDKSMTFLYAVRGKGTKLMSKINSGEEIEIFGPLGNGFDVSEYSGKVAVVAGGIGIAPMVQLVKELESCKVDLFAGFRNSVYSVEEIKDKVENTYVSTEDGSAGHKGFVTDLLNPGEYEAVLCCGPEIMMKKVVEKCRQVNVPVYVSMENHMACGVGACLVCTCKTIFGNLRTCKDGPVFKGDDLVI